jgi:S-adenosyl methyltransferase
MSEQGMAGAAGSPSPTPRAGHGQYWASATIEEEFPVTDDSRIPAQTSLPEIDTTVPHSARIWNYWLGGKDNFAVDRAAGEAFSEIFPGMVDVAHAVRGFLARAVTYLAGETGIRQFLDIGTGIPTAGNTHQVAQKIAPESRVVYVDYDPIVLAHARALLTSKTKGTTAYVDSDLRDTGKILNRASQVLDFTNPVAVTLLSILHAVVDADDPHAIVATLMDAVPPGSYLAISHAGSDLIEPEALQALYDSWKGKLQQPFQWRDHAEVARFFAGMDLVEPGLVRVDDWRPDPGAADTPRAAMWAAVARKR